MDNGKKITISKIKEVIASKRWDPYAKSLEEASRASKLNEERKWLMAVLKILEGEVGISEDEFRYRFGTIGIDAMGQSLS